MKNNAWKTGAGMTAGGKFWRKAAGLALSAAVMAGMMLPAVPANAAAGTQTFTKDGTAKVAVTATVPEKVTADYTVVLPTSVNLEYDSGADNYQGILDAGVYGTVDQSCVVYTRIAADPDALVNRDPSGKFIEGAAPDGSGDTAGTVTRWYKLTEAGGDHTAYLTAVQSIDKNHIMTWVDSAVTGTLAAGEVKMAADSAAVERHPIASLSADLTKGGSYSGNVMVEFGVAEK